MPRIVHACNKEAEISAIQTSLKLFIPQIKELMEANLDVVKEQIASNHRLQMLEFNDAKEKQVKISDRVMDLESEQREIVRHQKIIRLIYKYPVRSVAIILMALSFLVVLATWLDTRAILAYVK